MSTEHFVGTVALIGIVILVSSLLSSAAERTGLPHVAFFILLGALLGPAGLGLVDLPLRSATLQVIATLALVLILFSDAIGLDTGEVRAQRRLAALILGPGTLIPAALIGVAAWLLLGLPVPAAAILGASLASTDPVLLRTLVRSPELPSRTRLALRLESGMNDVILLPIVIIAMMFVPTPDAPNAIVEGREIGRHLLGLFVLGPGLGAAIGWLAITVLAQVRTRLGVRRDYESIYALGVAFSAFAAAEAAGGSGFLSAFTAGLVIASLDVELCDCFLDFGEAAAEMFLLLTFVAFGATLIWSGLEVADLRALVFTVVALSVRTVVLWPVLASAGLEHRDRRLIAFAGPRGLSSLLLALLPVFAGASGATRLFALTCLVVLASVLLHGVGFAIYLRRQARLTEPSRPSAVVATAGRVSPAALPVTASDAAATPDDPTPAGERPDGEVPLRITLDEVHARQARGEPVVLIDARTERAFREDPVRPEGVLRMPPDEAVRLARQMRLDQHATLVVYCA